MTTKTATHTPTPWEVGHELGNSFSIVRALNDRDLLPIAEVTYTQNYRVDENRPVAKANAAHIVKCVNTMPLIEKALDEAMQKYGDYAEAREALNMVLDAFASGRE